ASPKLAQKPFGPSGQYSGSARKNKNTASPRNISGQIFAQEKYRLRESSAKMPIKRTIRPAQAWLYSDQAMSPGVSGCAKLSPGMNAAGTFTPASFACLTISLPAGDKSPSSGLLKRGIRGA